MIGGRVDYQEFIRQEEASREGVFLETAQRLGTTPNNVEKDFWICLVLDTILMDGSKRWPRLVFRGGTSLSRAYKAINRFSEDIDLAISRHDLGVDETISTLIGLEPEERQKRLDVLNKAGADFVARTIVPHLEERFKNIFSHEKRGRPSVRIDRHDPLTIEVPYLSITREDDYVPTAVRLEFSIRSALEPRADKSFSPYIAETVPNADMQLVHIPTIAARRTFWDKMLITHELKDRHSKGLPLAQHNDKVSRHYYDLYMLIRGKKISLNKNQIALAKDCQKHSALFYPNPAVDISDALPGTFDIIPGKEMTQRLLQDYRRMSVMIFGEAPDFEDIKKTLADFERQVNAFRAKAVGNEQKR
jgi:hypothetical protein